MADCATELRIKVLVKVICERVVRLCRGGYRVNSYILKDPGSIAAASKTKIALICDVEEQVTLNALTISEDPSDEKNDNSRIRAKKRVMCGCRLIAILRTLLAVIIGS